MHYTGVQMKAGILIIAGIILASCGTSQTFATRDERADHVNFTFPSAKVSKVEDGDTLTLTGQDNIQFKIRMSDIDTPETFHKARSGGRDQPGQPMGRDAGQSLKDLALGKTVKAECYEADQYARLVCHVFVGDMNLNLEQLRRGWAWATNNAKWRRDPESLPAMEAAKTQKKGIWVSNSNVAPWDWRRDCWGEAQKCPDADMTPFEH
jgi:micrococcal nuclease